MEAPHVYIVTFDERNVECYGDLCEDSNLSVVCEDEREDCVWLQGCIATGKPFTSWEEVVMHLQPYFNSDILQIESC